MNGKQRKERRACVFCGVRARRWWCEERGLGGGPVSTVVEEQDRRGSVQVRIVQSVQSSELFVPGGMCFAKPRASRQQGEGAGRESESDDGRHRQAKEEGEQRQRHNCRPGEEGFLGRQRGEEGRGASFG